MCDGKSAYRKPDQEPPREPEDIYAEYLRGIEDFKKRMGEKDDAH